MVALASAALLPYREWENNVKSNLQGMRLAIKQTA